MKVIEARGTHRAVGQAIGEGLRDEIRAHVEGFVLQTPEALAQPVATYRNVLNAYLPRVLEQFEGMAEGAGLASERILALNLPVGVGASMFAPQGCTNVAFAAGPDGALWGKNNDGHFPPDAAARRDGQGRRPWAVLKLYPDDGIPALCVTFCGWLSGGDMMNAEGLAVGHSSVGSRFRQSPLHVPALQWLYWILFRSRDLQAFQKNVTMLPLCGKGFATLAVDRQGAMCSAEIACPLVQLRLPRRGAPAMHAVNHYQLPELEGMHRRTPEGLANSLARSRLLEQECEAGNRSLEHLRHILRRHGQPALCRHGGADQAWTEFSVIGLTARATLMVAPGCPCTGEYVSVPL